MPTVHLIEDLPDDRARLWMEDVVSPAAASWDGARFRSAAVALGRLAARWRDNPLPETARYPRGHATRSYYEGRVVHELLPAIRDAEAWQHPLLAGHRDDDLRADLLALNDRVPAIFAALASAPAAFSHGDASPQNLLISAATPDEFVVIDWGGFVGLDAVGADLGQLLVGLAHAGEIDAAQLPDIHTVIVEGYVAGLAAEGMSVDARDVVRGFVGSLVVRSAFTAIPFERLHAEPNAELETLFDQRIRLTRYIVDLAAQIFGTSDDAR
ncbi:MAG: phosphotransferase [Frankia sp.]|nr:phosphotransferase [Frankia sp.]